MSLELVNTFATLATFVVIAATAIAAIVQLRHARRSNQIAALNELRASFATAELMDAESFVLRELPEKLKDPAFRHQADVVSARTGEVRALILKALEVGNFYESMGVFVKNGLVDRALVLQGYDDVVINAWDSLAPALAIFRRRRGNGLWENFEYLTVLAQDWKAAHPNGTYPAGARRIELKDEFLEADEQYAASLEPA
jgi:hypothetical protein